MNQPSSLRTALQFGAYSGVASFTGFISIYFAGYNPIGDSGWLVFWVPVLFIVIGLNQYKKTDCKGYLSYSEALKMGLRISIAAAFVFSCFLYIFSTGVNNSLLEMFKTDFLDQLEIQKPLYSQKVYDNNIAALEMITMSTIIFVLAIAKVIGGLIISLIVAAIVKNTTVEFNNEEGLDANNISSTEKITNNE